MSTLPTSGQMLTSARAALDRARNEAEEALAWLRSDWQPLGSPLTAEQAVQRDRMRAAAARIKDIVDEAKQ